MNTITQLKTVKANTATKVANELSRTGGLLRLAPAWVPRSFIQPGLRIKLHPDDTYAYGLNRGGIDERWFASTTVTANEGRAADEGLNYCVVGRERCTLKQAVDDCGATLVGKCIWKKYGKWPFYSKFFDNMGPIPHHMRQSAAQAKLVGQEGKPESYYFPPQHNQYSLLTTVMIRMEDAGRVKKWLFDHFMDLARRVGPALMDGKPVSAIDRLHYRLGDLLIYGPLRNTLGFSRVRVAYTAGEASGPDLFTFYRSIGINLKQLYGSTETAVFVCLQPDHRHQVRLSPYVAARLPSLMVDPILIEQVLINLLKNAGEAIAQAGRPPGERYIERRVGPRRLEDQEVVEFSVRDSGNGVPAEMIERIYEAFYSTKAEGMGIGPKLCRSIVESHHGRMQVQNIYNGDEVVGCCFSFWIPVQSRLTQEPEPGASTATSLTDTERAR